MSTVVQAPDIKVSARTISGSNTGSALPKQTVQEQMFVRSEGKDSDSVNLSGRASSSTTQEILPTRLLELSLQGRSPRAVTNPLTPELNEEINKELTSALNKNNFFKTPDTDSMAMFSMLAKGKSILDVLNGC